MSSYNYAPSTWCTDPNWYDRCCALCEGIVNFRYHTILLFSFILMYYVVANTIVKSMHLVTVMSTFLI